MHWIMPEFTSCETYSIIWKLCENVINYVFAYLLSGSEREIKVGGGEEEGNYTKSQIFRLDQSGTI